MKGAIMMCSTSSPPSDPTPLYECTTALKNGIDVNIQSGMEIIANALAQIGERNQAVSVQPVVTLP